MILFKKEEEIRALMVVEKSYIYLGKKNIYTAIYLLRLKWQRCTILIDFV